MLATLGLSPKPRIFLTKHNDHKINSVGNWIRSAVATTATIGVSQFVSRMLLKSPYRRHPVTTVRHGVDTDYFAPVSEGDHASLRARYLMPDAVDKIVLGSSGGTDDDKGWLDLAGALALLSPVTRSRFHVVVIGDPPTADQVARLQNIGVQGQFSFPGLVDDVRPLLASCDVGFVLSYREALSFACRELMAQGLPVIVTDVGGLPENLTHCEEGWIVPVRDPSAIAGILNTIAADKDLLKTMGQRARIKALQDFNLNKFVTETLAVYTRCHE
jgi:glycosyltransferase involved in cell wall biosynthesis